MILITILLLLFALTITIFRFFSKERIRPDVQFLGELIVNNYNSGMTDGYTYSFLNDSGNRVFIWIANGINYTETYKSKSGFNYPEKRYIYKCISLAILKKAIN